MHECRGMGKDSVISFLKIRSKIQNFIINIRKILLDKFLQGISLEARTIIVGGMEGNAANTFHFFKHLFIVVFNVVGRMDATNLLVLRYTGFT